MADTRGQAQGTVDFHLKPIQSTSYTSTRASYTLYTDTLFFVRDCFFVSHHCKSKLQAITKRLHVNLYRVI